MPWGTCTLKFEFCCNSELLSLNGEWHTEKKYVETGTFTYNFLTA